jgi:hypothetical protein
VFLVVCVDYLADVTFDLLSTVTLDLGDEQIMKMYVKLTAKYNISIKLKLK